jgi:hypothetical protein
MSPNEKIIRLREYIESLKLQIDHLEEKEAHDRFWLIIITFMALVALWKTTFIEWLP